MKNIFVYKAVGDFVNKDYLTDCVKDLMTYYKTRDFIQMAVAYDEIESLIAPPSSFAVFPSKMLFLTVYPLPL